MKKSVLIAVSIILTVIISLGVFRYFIAEDGSYWSANTTQFRSDKVGRLQAQGEDLRVYEFTPQSAPSKQCVFVAGTNKGGLVCFDKGSK